MDYLRFDVYVVDVTLAGEIDPLLWRAIVLLEGGMAFVTSHSALWHPTIFPDF